MEYILINKLIKEFLKNVLKILMKFMETNKNPRFIYKLRKNKKK